MVAVKSSHRSRSLKMSPTILTMLSLLSFESCVMIIGYKSVLYNIALLLPFRIVLWAMLMEYQLNHDNKPNFIYYTTILSLPYLIGIVFFSEWFLQLELSKLSYLSGLLFTPLYITFCTLYTSTMSIGFGIEVMCIGAFIIVSVLQALFHSTLVPFWHAMMLPYYQSLNKLLNLNISNNDFNQLLLNTASGMTSVVVICHLLSPMITATLVVLFLRKHNQQIKDWLSMKMSWSAFTMVMPLFFMSYLIIILQKSQLINLSHLPLATIGGLFELARFIPAVCGLSVIHFWLSKRFAKKQRMQTIMLVSTSIIFSWFGALFYPICAFLGLIDRVTDLRQESKIAKN